MIVIKNSSFKEQLALIKFFSTIILIGIPIFAVLLSGEGDLPNRVSIFFTNLKVMLFILIFIVIAFGVNIILKIGILDEYNKYNKISEVHFKEDKVIILITDGKEIEIPWKDIINVDYASFYEYKKNEYSRNNIIIQKEDELLVFPFTSKEIYYKFVDILDNGSMLKGNGEE